MEINNDVQFIINAVEAIKKANPNKVDPARVYVFSIATGGFMTARLACEAPEYFQAIASFAGATYTDSTKCNPEATNYLGVHGTDDTVVPTEGGVNIKGIPFPSFTKSMFILSNAYGCQWREIEKNKFTLPSEATQRRAAKQVDVEVTNFEDCDGNVNV